MQEYKKAQTAMSIIENLLIAAVNKLYTFTATWLFVNNQRYNILCISFFKRRKAIRRRISVKIIWFSSNKMNNILDKSKLINYLYEQDNFEMLKVN